MAELFDKEGNPISEVFDSEGNPLDETLTPDEVEAKINEAKEEAKGEFETETQKLQGQIDEKETALKAAEEELEKEKEKDKNFGKLRGTAAEKEKEVETLKGEVKGMKEEIEGIKVDTKKQPVTVMIKKLAGDDEELEKKIKFHYESFNVPDDDTEEKQKERITNAYTLATGGKPVNPLSGEAVSSGGGVAPGGEELESKGKLSDPGASDVGEKLGIPKESQRRHKLI